MGNLDRDLEPTHYVSGIMRYAQIVTHFGVANECPGGKVEIKLIREPMNQLHSLVRNANSIRKSAFDLILAVL